MATIANQSEARLEPQARPSTEPFVGTALLVIAALFVVVQLMAGEIIPPLAVPAVLYAGLGIVLLRRAPRWLVITTVALVVVHLVTSIPFFIEALAHPETPATFLPDAIVLVTALALVAGAIAGWRGTTSRRPIGLAAGGVTIGLIVVSLVAAAGVESHAREPGDVVVEASGAEFPEQLVVPADGAVLWVDNKDAFRHTIVVEDAGVHTELPGSSAVRVNVDLAPGEYRYFCDVPGHEGMEGTLVVQ